jgi:hypothetical protein
MKFVIGCVLVVLCVFLCYRLKTNMACEVFLCCVLVVFGSFIIRFDDCFSFEKISFRFDSLCGSFIIRLR